MTESVFIGLVIIAGSIRHERVRCGGRIQIITVNFLQQGFDRFRKCVDIVNVFPDNSFQLTVQFHFSHLLIYPVSSSGDYHRVYVYHHRHRFHS